MIAAMVVETITVVAIGATEIVIVAANVASAKSVKLLLAQMMFYYQSVAY